MDWRGEKTTTIVRWLGVEEMTYCEITSDDLDNHKPRPDPNTKTVSALQVDPNEAMVTEDPPKAPLREKQRSVKYSLFYKLHHFHMRFFKKLM